MPNLPFNDQSSSLTDKNKLSGEINDIFNEDMRLKSSLLKVWQQNIHFLNGQQTMEFDQFQRKFQNVPVLNNRSNRPQVYVTNEIEPVVRTLVSFLTRNKPKARAYPSDPDDDASVRRARIAELVIDATWDVDREYDRYVQAAYWLFTVGTVFRKDYWDASARGQIHLPAVDPMAGQMQTQMDQQTGPDQVDPQETNGQSGINNVIQGPRHWGDMAASILTPLQMAVDFPVTEFSSADWLMEYSMQKVDWVQEQYNIKAPGYTGRIGEVKAQENFGKALEADLRFRFQTPMVAAAKPTPHNMCVMKEFYQAPKANMPWNQNTNAKPRGRLIVVAHNITLYDGPSSYNWHPYTACTYEPFLGRFWGKSLVEQLVSSQRRLNEINGVVLENSQTMANPQWSVYDGSVPEGSISGKGGLVVKWKRVGDQVVAPQKMPGVPLPAQYFQERTGLIDQIVRIAGTNAILQGTPPAGISAAAGLQLLLENAQSQHGPLMNNWELFYERSQTVKLQNFQRFGREARTDLVQYLKRLRKDISDLDIDAITGDMLEDEVSVSIEAGSSIPKSQAARQSQLMELGKMGVLGDIVHDPIVNQQFLSEFGITEFNQSTSAEWEKIKWENGRMLKGQPASPSPFDNHQLHLPQHIAEIQKPSFIEGASPQAQQAFQEHIAWHQQRQGAAQQQAQSLQEKGMETQGKFELMKENIKKAPVFDPNIVNQAADAIMQDQDNPSIQGGIPPQGFNPQPPPGAQAPAMAQ